MDAAISFRSLGKQMILKQLAKNNFCIILLCSVSLMTNQIIELNHIIFDWFGFFFFNSSNQTFWTCDGSRQFCREMPKAVS
jgi:hypothetical protein